MPLLSPSVRAKPGSTPAAWNWIQDSPSGKQGPNSCSRPQLPPGTPGQEAEANQNPRHANMEASVSIAVGVWTTAPKADFASARFSACVKYVSSEESISAQREMKTLNSLSFSHVIVEDTGRKWN